MAAATLLLPVLAAAAALALALLWRRQRRLGAALAARSEEVERLRERNGTLRESEERYRSLVEVQSTAVVQRDAAGRITFANEGFAQLLDVPLIALVGSERGPAVAETGEVVLAPDGTRGVDEAIVPAGGGPPRWFAWIETTVAGRDGRPEILRAGRDITDRVVAARSLEEARHRAEAASVAKSRFLATVSHEFRTPLNGILGMAALVLETGLSPEQATYVRAVRMSGEALLSLIDGILDFSKIEAGRFDLAAEPFEVAPLVEGVVELLAPRAQDKGIEIAGFVAGAVPRRMVGDPDRIRQILINLAGNAVKFTEAGGVGVSVEATPEGLSLAVADTGPGIPAERLPLLFEEFEQGDGSASRRHEGTGLGLAITRRLVERMGGRIEASSTPGTGSLFRVLLPLPAIAKEPVPGLAPTPSLAGRKVLIVARSPFEGPFLCRRLAEAGAEARQIEDPREATAGLAGGGFDAVIADRGLGDAAVREVAQAARAAGIARRLVLLSPFDRRDFGAPDAAGFDGYLVKPVRSRSLAERLSEAPPDAAPQAGAAAAPARPSGRGARVLLAEDNEINALLATRALERSGAEVVWARDGLEAVALAVASLQGRSPAFDLALVDIRMPGLDGLATVRRIREAGGRMRIVALTANARPEDERMARGAGFDGFLAKPIDLQALRALVSPADAAAA